MPHYLIYQDSSVDEGSRTIIVGPFATPDDRAAVRGSHKHNSGGGWGSGGYGWECAGDIDGQVSGFDIESPHELLNHYPNTAEDIARVRACADTLAGMGFPAPEWVGELDSRLEREFNGRAVAAQLALRAWAAESQRDLMRLAFGGVTPGPAERRVFEPKERG